jgi:LuxR family transcriptional regulator, maltose regulon positive regulatory protein
MRRPMAVPVIDRPRAGGAMAARRGQVNQRSARDLVVALDTVKKHVTHILGKLGAADRTQAGARARDLGLIP